MYNSLHKYRGDHTNAFQSRIWCHWLNLTLFWIIMSQWTFEKEQKVTVTLHSLKLNHCVPACAQLQGLPVCTLLSGMWRCDLLYEMHLNGLLITPQRKWLAEEGEPGQQSLDSFVTTVKGTRQPAELWSTSLLDWCLCNIYNFIYQYFNICICVHWLLIY